MSRPGDSLQPPEIRLDRHGGAAFYPEVLSRLSWYHQGEHLEHLAPIVKRTAAELGLPYHENASFLDASRSHVRTSRVVGRA